MADDEAKKAKQAEIERKRAEVRKRMEEASKAKKAKKGFMTPERKKKLRLLLRKKAAEELKKEQERKAAERRRIIEERCGSPRNLSDASEDTLQKVCQDYYSKVLKLESEKYDVEREVARKEFEASVAPITFSFSLYFSLSLSLTLDLIGLVPSSKRCGTR
ncbi:troponin I isoform X2 [Drosophila navojoa]|uniref:troponin I isoform X2 n=1 Tax=Drosophila navojoa TaxID=7232 RepID=UPI0011BDADA7|nr:troponin I isoform X2 [Drosophila navojoa]